MKSVTVVFLACLPLLPSTATAQQIDMALIQKWSRAEVVRYHVEGAYRAWTPVSQKWQMAEGDVSDSLTVDFEWNLRQRQIVGQAKFANGRSSVAGVRSTHKECPAAKLAGEYEHMTATRVETDQPSRVAVKGVRNYAATSAPLECPSSLKLMPAPGGEAAALEYLPVIDPKLLAVGITGDPKVSISADKQSFVVKVGGWSWTCTPTLVK